MAIREEALEAIARDTQQLTNRLAQSIQNNVPVVTGRLRDSVETTPTGVVIGAPYASEVNERHRFVELAELEVLGRL